MRQRSSSLDDEKMFIPFMNWNYEVLAVGHPGWVRAEAKAPSARCICKMWALFLYSFYTSVTLQL